MAFVYLPGVDEFSQEETVLKVVRELGIDLIDPSEHFGAIEDRPAFFALGPGGGHYSTKGIAVVTGGMLDYLARPDIQRLLEE